MSERRLYNDWEKRLIKRGEPERAKVSWSKRWQRATMEERRQMVPAHIKL